jgi:type II secretory pathway component GspD/PulD (secretin)
MKTENIFTIIVAVVATCLAAPGQTPTPTNLLPPLTPPPNTGPVTNAPLPEPILEPVPLPEDRNVSYSPLVGSEAVTATAPISDEVVDVVAFDGVALPDAIRTLALQAGLNIQFDPNLMVTADGRPITPPPVTEKWHKLTATQALQALLDNWGWQLTWDPRTKVGRVTKKNLAAKEPLVVTVVALRYGNPTNILKEVKDTLSVGSDIVADMRTHQLIVRTTERELYGVEALINKLDTATRQVLVEAKLVETSKDISSAKGVDWTGTLAAQHISFGNGITQGTSISGTSNATGLVNGTSTVSPGGSGILGTTGAANITSNVTSFTSTITGDTQRGGGFTLNTARGISPATAFLNADGVSAVLSFLNTDNDSKVIAFPRSVALDGVPTELMVVQNIPIFQQTQSAPAGGSASGLATILPVYDLKVGTTILNEVGVKLQVTPRIAGPTNVLLDVKPEISQQLPGLVSETLNGQVNQAPAFSRSRITTQASVPSGYTLVLGGMDQDTVNNTFTKVPFFGDLPGLGNLFRSSSKDHQKQTVLIFVTPTIVSDTDYQPATDTFLKRKGPSVDEKREPPWDTGEPYDWTKPRATVYPHFEP